MTFLKKLSIPFIFLLLSSCDFSISNKLQEPIEWYSFGTSTFQLKDLLDSMVFSNRNFFYDSTDYFKQKELNFIYNRDTIKYFLHFSGDHLDWATKPDSSYLALDKFDRRQPENTFDENKTLNAQEIGQYHQKFKQAVINLLDSLIKREPRYIIKSLTDEPTESSRWIICKPRISSCDTFIMKREKGYYILSDSH